MDDNELQVAVQHMGAENIALQTLVMGLMQQLTKSGHRDIAEGAFDYADQALESAVIALGKNSPPWYSRRALEILEQFRRMAFAGH